MRRGSKNAKDSRRMREPGNNINNIKRVESVKNIELISGQYLSGCGHDLLFRTCVTVVTVAFLAFVIDALPCSMRKSEVLLRIPLCVLELIVAKVLIVIST